MARYIDKTEFFNSIRHVPHSAGQRGFHQSRARFKVPACGRRYGKSTMAARDLEPELFLPGRRYWCVGPTYDLGEKEFRVVWDDLIIRKQLGRDKRVRRMYNKRSGDMFIEFPWQTRLEVKSAAHPETLVGDALHGVIMAEAAKHNEDTWNQYIRPALADFKGWATFPSTPEGRNWYYDVWKLGLDPNMTDYAAWSFPSWDNPILFPGGRDDPEIVLLEKTMSPESFMQEIGADFQSFVGRIYPEFDETTHVTDIPYRPEWKNYLFFDFGFVNPLAAIEVMVSPSDDVYVWREHYKAQQTVEMHCAELKERAQPSGYHLDLATGDAADPEAAMVVSQKLVGCLAMPEAKANWREGIDLVKSFLKPQQIGYDEWERPIERPKLFVDRSCVNVIREFNTYRMKDKTKNADAAEGARKIDDHALDALRYGLMHIFVLGVQHHLSETQPASPSSKLIVPRGYFTSEVSF